MRLTRRGRALVLVLMVAGFVAALIYAYNTGQASQCAWFRTHGTPAQISEHCGP